MVTPTFLLLRRPLLFLFAGLLLVPATRAQPLAVETVTGGLSTPLGVDVGPDGWVWVGNAGTGNDDGHITVVSPDGVPHPFMTGLRSVTTAEGTAGVNQIRLHGDDLWIALGLSEEVPEGYLLVVDVSGWAPGDPPLTPADVDRTYDVGAFVLGQGFPQTNVYDLDFSADGQTAYLTDSSANAVLALDVDTGALTVLATLADIPNPTDVGPPFVQAVPTGIVARDGVLYVGALTGFPFVPGLARVYEVEGGVASVYRAGLTSVTDVAFDPEDGQLVALEFARFDLMSGFLPGTGRLVKLYEHGPRQVLADGQNLTAALAIRGDDHLFTSLFGLLLHATPTVDLDVTPDAPVTMPGPVQATVTVTNDTDAAQTVTVRVLLIGDGLQQRAARTVTLGAGQSVTRSLSFTPPAGAAFRLAFVAEDAGGVVLDSDRVTVDLPLAARAGDDVRIDLDALVDFGAPAAAVEAPQAARLVGSAPNPFVGAATLTVALPEAAPVRLAVYDALGREVAVLVDAALDAGTHPVRFEAAGLPSGVYVARLTAGGTTEALRMTLLR